MGIDLRAAMVGFAIIGAVGGGVVAVVLWEVGKWLWHHVQIGWTP